MLIPGKRCISSAAAAATCGVAAEVPKKLGSVPVSEHCPVPPAPITKPRKVLLPPSGPMMSGFWRIDGRLRMARGVKEDRVTALGGEGLQQRRRNGLAGGGVVPEGRADGHRPGGARMSLQRAARERGASGGRDAGAVVLDRQLDASRRRAAGMPHLDGDVLCGAAAGRGEIGSGTGRAGDAAGGIGRIAEHQDLIGIRAGRVGTGAHLGAGGDVVVGAVTAGCRVVRTAR